MFYRNNLIAIVIASVLSVTVGYSTNRNNNNNQANRRDMLKTVVSGSVAFVTLSSLSTPVNAAINACPNNSKNCIRTTWTVPDGTKDANKKLYTILQQYPQEGQADIDLGGWKIVSGDLNSGDTTTRIEYSSGVGKFAKFFNGGKSFIDDLDIEIMNGNTIEIRSSSRVGDSDFDVNKKRLLFLGSKAKELGWTIPEPKY